jgi:uncharacterized protein YodC (DUF2158 family)
LPFLRAPFHFVPLQSIQLTPPPPPTEAVPGLKRDNAEAEANPCAFVLDHRPIVCRVPSERVNFRVAIANPFAEAVKFRDFACDCGCSSGKFTVAELGPGQDAAVEMTVVLAGREGAQRFTCRWFDGTGREWSATVRVTVYRPTQFEPKAIRLGTLEPNTVVQRTVIYDEYATDPADFPPPPGFGVSSTHPVPVRLENAKPITETLDGGLLRRRTTLNVSLTVPNGEGSDELFLVPSAPPLGAEPTSLLRVDWAVRELLSLSPKRIAISFDNTNHDKQTQVLRVRSTGSGVVIVKKVVTTDPSVEARISTNARSINEDTLIEVTVTLPDDRRLLVAEVVLTVDAPAAREAHVPVTAIRRGP